MTAFSVAWTGIGVKAEIAGAVVRGLNGRVAVVAVDAAANVMLGIALVMIGRGWRAELDEIADVVMTFKEELVDDVDSESVEQDFPVVNCCHFARTPSTCNFCIFICWWISFISLAITTTSSFMHDSFS